jgi:thiamine pyrophosphokinase
MKPLLQNLETIVLADGAFPTHAIPLSFLNKAKQIICCDGATKSLLQYGLEPTYIVGDMDTLSDDLKKKYASIIFYDSNQDNNDLTKAICFCIKNGWDEVTILGATGNREDHSLGNLSLLADYGQVIRVQLLTDYGVFTPQYLSTVYESYKGQQVSLFSLTANTKITTKGLLYPIVDRCLISWWDGTLNESAGDNFEIITEGGKSLVFREYIKPFFTHSIARL